jgi:hypothetical protein
MSNAASSLAQHSSASVEWYTPPEIVDAARTLMGGIDFDPASSLVANDTVRASRYLTEGDDALSPAPWSGRTFCNPPGGKRGNRSLQKLFWERLTTEWRAGAVSQAVFLAFSVEALQSTQSLAMPMTRFPVCIPSKRIRFLSPDGEPMGAPTHANAIVWLPPYGASVEPFVDAFSWLGEIMVPREWPRAERA